MEDPLWIEVWRGNSHINYYQWSMLHCIESNIHPFRVLGMFFSGVILRCLDWKTAFVWTLGRLEVDFQYIGMGEPHPTWMYVISCSSGQVRVIAGLFHHNNNSTYGCLSFHTLLLLHFHGVPKSKASRPYVSTTLYSSLLEAALALSLTISNANNCQTLKIIEP